ncbi:LacI family transcriptional regulator [Reticulibacter mediterranei]|uniref:LacI family transcriptional regulator n=1 Tax=Reticulibacter mediterranei TaxID=2778369 RepID=A0A8J3N6H8_9CHLR|nr:LacI family DNA-binding transcriptional regulator [Reticulibacter mediterranei]GHP00210.1 LacI family transcriptional regulator [Reticulibacter mediterranei]
MVKDKKKSFHEVTIQDVARLAGVSPTSVSNVLNGRLERMGKETVERIQRAIKQLGYTPSLVARQLKTGYVPIIGLIVPSVANPFWGAFASAAEETALRHGFRVLLCNSERNLTREQSYAEDMWAQGIRAIIFGSSSLSLTHLFSLVERGLHTITFDRHTQPDDSFDIDSVSIDNMLAGRLATEHLLALGHRRIGLLSGPIRTVSRIDRLRGYRAALAEAGIAVDPRLIWEAAPDSSFGDIEGAVLSRIGARELLSLEHPPSAIIGINDLYALGAYAGVHDMRLSIPSACSIVGFDDIMFAEIAQPPLTTIRQPLQEMLRVAVERLIERLEHANDAGDMVHHSFTPELIVRGSTAPILT